MEHKMLTLLFILSSFLTIFSSTSTSYTIEDYFIQPDALDLSARLEDSGGISDCWNALMELRSCSNEVIAFFLDGHADISPDCCNAVTTITHSCWPAMLRSLGFTAEEGHVLSGYCDTHGALSPVPASSPCA